MSLLLNVLHRPAGAKQERQEPGEAKGEEEMGLVNPLIHLSLSIVTNSDFIPS